MQHERFHNADNGHPPNAERVEISDTIVVGRYQAKIAAPAEEQEFEVVGIVEDATSTQRYAVCYCESGDEFIVTDESGAPLEDETLAQEILEDFLEQAPGAEDEEET